MGLGMFDLGIPIRSLHQPHRDTAAPGASLGRQPVEQGQGAFAIGLHHESELGASGPCSFKQAFEYVQGQLQPVGFFRVDSDGYAAGGRCPAQVRADGNEFIEDPPALAVFIARMQGRQLDRQGRVGHARFPAEFCNSVDGVPVCAPVAIRGRGVSGRLAEHVPGIPFARPAALQGLFDRRAHHELAAEDAHGCAHGGFHHGLAQAAAEAAEPGLRVTAEFAFRLNQFASEHQRPSGSVHHKRAGFADVGSPVRQPQAVRDQPFGGGVVGNPQQAFGQAHQGDAFLVAESIFDEKGIEQ